MQRLFGNMGGRQGLRPGDIVRAISGTGGISGGEVGVIDIHDDFSFVEIPRAAADRVIAVLRRTRIGGRPVNAEVARARNGG
jgi:ATP-dependent RNA helicase DeaD